MAGKSGEIHKERAVQSALKSEESQMTTVFFFLYTRIEICCLIVIAYIAYSFFSVKRRVSYVHRLFSLIVLCSLLNMIFDFITVYTVNHLDSVPPVINRLCHMVFMGSLSGVVFCTYLYVRALIYPAQKPGVILWAPFVISVLSAALLPIKYTTGGYTNYSDGIAPRVTYICIYIYFALILWLFIRFHKSFQKKQLRGITTAVLTILVITSFQAIFPQSLISSVGVMMLNIAIFFTMENPDATLLDELEFERNKADEANKAKSRFLAGISHEIRTPVNAILGMDEMILREADEEAILEYAMNIRQAGNILLSLINDILDFSRIEAGKMELAPENYELSSVINDLLGMMADKAKAKGIVLILHADNNLPKSLYGDCVRIKQCILVLLNNAIKYTDQGNVTLGITHRKIDDRTVRLKISVRDTGIGIKKETLEKIGSASGKIDDVRYGTEGSGLGLSIVKELLALMGSGLQVQSEYGKGTEFSFEVDQQVADWTEIGGIEDSYKSTLAGLHACEERLFAPKAKVLYVDDTQMNLDVIRGLLKRSAVQLDTALSGTEALDLVRKKEYDIIFIDHKMPEPDGIETLALMRALPDNKCSDAPCIMLTANAISGVRQMYLDAGFTDYLSKPVNPQKLEDMLRTYLPKNLVEVLKIPKKEDDSAMPKIDGIDVAAALRNLGTRELMERTILQYYSAIDQTAQELDDMLAGGDVKSYGIKIHSLKTTSRLIGAKVIYNQAQYLELCADRNDIEAIRQTHPFMIATYRGYKEKLGGFCRGIQQNSVNQKKMFTNQQISDFLAALSACIDNFDSEGIDNLVNDAKNHTMPDDFSAQFERICSLAEKIDFDGLRLALK